MNRTVVVALCVLAVFALLLSGCTSGPKYNYPTGYAAYGGNPGQGGGGGQHQQNNYIGGGCAVDGPEHVEHVMPETVAAA